MFNKFTNIYAFWLRLLVNGLIYLSGLALLAMMFITIFDVVVRALRIRFIGAVDLVQFAGAVCVAAALPYTTAIGGHVAIEFFFHKLSHLKRLVLGSILKIMLLILFGSACVWSFSYGNSLRGYNQISMTLGIPLYWIMYVISICLGAVVLVVFYELLCPHKELIKQ